MIVLTVTILSSEVFNQGSANVKPVTMTLILLVMLAITLVIIVHLGPCMIVLIVMILSLLETTMVPMEHVIVLMVTLMWELNNAENVTELVLLV